MTALSPATATEAPAPVHGGLVHDELRALRIEDDDVLDFSVNVNPYGPCAEVRRAVAGARIDRYPDPAATPARLRIAEWLGVSQNAVLVANGAVDVFWTAARVLLRPGDTVLVAEPAFSEMRNAALAAGARIVECRSGPDTDFAFDEERFARLLRSERPRLAYVATPSNPSGALVSAAALHRLSTISTTTQLVADVSFASLSTRPDDAISASDGVLWVRSLTKELSVPGARVGFAVGPPSSIAAMHQARPPWSVNAIAEAVAIAATTSAVRDFVASSRARLLDDRARLEVGLRRFGLSVHPSETAYVLADLGARDTGSRLRRALLERHRVLVRDAASFGLPHHVRIAARPGPDADRLFFALEKELRT
jgi:histidinol-phosphate/aromatic aminotransferase/cobyric acid decarboxylase-like protein